jgi:hypothetical protein
MKPVFHPSYLRRMQRITSRTTSIFNPYFVSSRLPLRTIMSSSPLSKASGNQAKDDSLPTEQRQDQASQNTPLPLPSPDSSTNDTTTIDLSSGSNTVALDHLGPLVVNKDGTLSRISNWGEMSEIERQNTVRVLGKRNMLRREALAEGNVKGEEAK